MSRERDPKNKRLPPYVYPRKSRNCYIHREYLGKGKFGKESRLCSIDEPISKVWAAYDSLNISSSTTLQWLLDTYNKCQDFRSLAQSTQAQYQSYRDTLCSAKTANGSTFGQFDLAKITRRSIRGYLDKAEFKVGANRHIQYLKAAWNWGSQRYAQVPEANPCEKVSLNKEQSRTRYVEDWEYSLVQDVIDQTTRSPHLSLMMEFAYLCRLRCSEVRALRLSDIEDGYIRILRGKGSDGELTRISPRLQQAITQSKALNPSAPAPIKGTYLIHTKKGLPISKNAFDSAWQRVMKKAVTTGIKIGDKQLKLEEPFNFHDLKAKGVSDHTEHESGHRSEKAHKIYMRKLRKVDATK